ncbi:GntP family permease [Sutcliffiella halmapala]|uniref:GntP family permease n=1 Tax=Sutcliffiella halmapala TaxID=79882 RepID=UPI000994C154|nr:SLC13 family permease [Sutcliffiella halmapala]
MALSFIGLIVGLGLLMYLTIKGINIIIAAVLCSTIVAVTGGHNLLEALTSYYMTGFTGFFASWFLTFLLGAIFGKVMEDTLAANAIADWVKRKFGAKRAVFAVVTACALMTYGGVSVFIVAFTVYPIAFSLFKSANLPHRFIPSALVFGSISFTMTSPGSPEIQNLIPTQHFGTTPTAGGWIGVIIALFIMVVGGIILGKMVKKAVDRGEAFSLEHLSEIAKAEVAATNEGRANEGETKKDLPNIFVSLLPLISVVIVLNIVAQFISTEQAVLIALFAGIVVGWGLMYKNAIGTHLKALTKGTENAINAIANTCAVVGFGAVAAKVPAFTAIVDALTNMPGLEYAGLAMAVTLIAAITGSASGGLGIALPILGPIYMAQGLDPGAMHRISALASGGLDSLPHNGYIVTTINGVCKETHKRAYFPVFIMSVVVPTIFLALAVVLYMIFH